MKRINVLVILWLATVVRVEAQPNAVYRDGFLDLTVKSSLSVDVDFLRLDSIVGGKKIIFLGEESHGDATTQKIKAKLIRYLVEKHGYRTLLIERSFFEMYKMDQFLRGQDLDPDYVLMEGFRDNYHISTASKWSRDAIKYLTTKYPDFEIRGVDIYLTSWYSKLLYNDLIDAGASKKIAKSYNDLLKSLGILEKDGSAAGIIDFDLENFKNITNSLIAEMDDRPEHHKHIIQALRSNLNLGNWYVSRPSLESFSNAELRGYMQLRDKAMAENLLWTISNSKNRKLIVSVSNYHMTRSVSDVATMVDYLPDSLIDQCYFMPFVHYQGTAGIRMDEKFIFCDSTTRNGLTLEQEFHNKGIIYGFIDNSKNKNRYKDSLLTIHASESLPQQFNWSATYDGVFFIDKMEYDIMKPLSINDYDYFRNTLYKRINR